MDSALNPKKRIEGNSWAIWCFADKESVIQMCVGESDNKKADSKSRLWGLILLVTARRYSAHRLESGEAYLAQSPSSGRRYTRRWSSS